MGIPQFINWLCHRCPKALEAAQEPAEGDSSAFDCLYLDLNGAVHAACHSQDDPLPARGAEQEMLLRTMASIDNVVAQVRPAKLLFLALDGVAPEGKWKEQRQRRFRKAAERLPDGKRPWDANAITPATGFMHRLSRALVWYCYERANSDPLFKHLSIVLSDSSVPGEGEHKIAHYIKQLRSADGYGPNTSHCIYGRDADLVTLSLLTCEHRVTIVRERDDVKQLRGGGAVARNLGPNPSPYDYIHVSTVREYLLADLEHLQGKLLAHGGFNFDRCVRDFVVLTMLVGGDVAPAIPACGIVDGGLETMFEYYRLNVEAIGGYLTTPAGDLEELRLADVVDQVAKREEKILARGRGARTDPVGYGAPGWRHRFDELHLDSRPMEVADAFVRSLRWRVRYYVSANVSWGGVYRFRHSPLPSQLSAALRRQVPHAAADLQPAAPPSPWAALFCVLPPQSCRLLPAPLRPMLADREGALRKIADAGGDMDAELAKKLAADAAELLQDGDRERGLTRLPLVFGNVDLSPAGAVLRMMVSGAAVKRKREHSVASRSMYSCGPAVTAAEESDRKYELGRDIVGLGALCGMLAPHSAATALGESKAPDVPGLEVDPVPDNRVGCAALVPTSSRVACGSLPGYEAPPPRLTARDRVDGGQAVYAV